MSSIDAALRSRYGEPTVMTWDSEISDAEWSVATYNPARFHDVTLFILGPPGNVGGEAADVRVEGRPPPAAGAERLALIRKPHFALDVWRPPGGGVKPGEDPTEAAAREALEETGLRIRLERYLVVTDAVFRNAGRVLPWQTHVLLARTDDTELAPEDPGEIADARWGTLAELAGPLREILLATDRAFWRYRVALHDAALAAIGVPEPDGSFTKSKP